jgi:PAS domain S-box-containing protein
MTSDGAGKFLSSRIWLISCLILLLLVAVGGWFVSEYLGYKARQEIIEYNESNISLHSSHLTSGFDKIERTVRTMSGSPWIVTALISRKEQDIANANSVLDRYNSNFESSVCYLMDGNGLTVAASNRNNAESFVGISYRFRPYFTQAIKGFHGRYLALGATSLKRGFYASYPVRDAKGVIIGVAVIKLDVDAEEEHLAKYPYCFVIDPNGVIFLSGRKELNFRSLWPVSRETRLALLKSKQFGEKEFEAIQSHEIMDGTEIIFEGKKYLASRKTINPEGWSILLMTTTKRILIYRLAGVILTILVCAFIVVPLIINYKMSRAAEMVRKSERRYRQLFERNLAGVYRATIGGRLLDCNNAFARIYGYESCEEIKEHAADDLHVSPKSRQEFIDALKAEGMLLDFESRGRRKDGSAIWLLENSTLISGEKPEQAEIEGTIVDITDRKLAEETVMRERDFTQTVVDSLPGLFYVFDDQGRFLRWNKDLEEVSGYSAQEIASMSPLDLLGQPDKTTIADAIQNVFLTGQTSVEADILSKNRTRTPYLFTGKLFLFEGKPCLIGMGLDITGRRLAETEKAKLEEQYHQAQKMEAIGQLAGGIAHDFNNMLNIIIGYSQMALMKIESSNPLNDDIQEIMNAARRSGDLVRQLLAFARKQTIAPKTLDLNDTVAGMLNMLRKLIGEDINLLWMPAANLWSVKMDPAQVDQILANLVVNARDSISGVGKITIETGNAEFDEAYHAQYTDFVPGQYVMLAVNDSGCGMDKETCEQIFEPFFTTKDIGKGTGMGLATVYGIVKQNKGIINVNSEPGRGTTFRIYLPRHGEEDVAFDAAPAHAEPLTGTETVLLVEDNEALLKMSKMMLEELGYTVLDADDPKEAIKLAAQYPGEIHLMLTDVVMPEMSGRDLQKRLSDLRPYIKCLFMSGYTADVIAHQGILDEGVHFLQKPFLMHDLASKVREAIGKT